MAKYKTQCNHYGDDNVALPGHERKDTAFSLHRKDSIQILIDYAEESEMVDKQTADKPDGCGRNSMSRLFDSQPRIGHAVEHDSNHHPNRSRNEQKGTFRNARLPSFYSTVFGVHVHQYRAFRRVQQTQSHRPAGCFRYRCQSFS